MSEDKRKEVYEYRSCINVLENGETCNREFFISVAEFEYFTTRKDERTGRPYTLPKRCYPCRIERRAKKAATDQGSNHGEA